MWRGIVSPAQKTNDFGAYAATEVSALADRLTKAAAAAADNAAAAVADEGRKALDSLRAEISRIAKAEVGDTRANALAMESCRRVPPSTTCTRPDATTWCAKPAGTATCVSCSP